MEARLDGDVVYAGGDARQRFYDARGYGRLLTDAERERWGASGVALSRVEAAHLLARGDLEAVRAADGERLEFRSFLARAGTRDAGGEGAGFLVRFLAYADLRGRGFYLSPAREGWPNAAGWDTAGVDFTVYPRGKGPADGDVGHRVRAVGERESVPVADLAGLVLAVADEESDVTYFETGRPGVEGVEAADPPTGLDGELLADRAVLWDPPAELYRREFYGRPLADRDAGRALQLSLVEAAYLAARGAVDFGASAPDPDTEAGSDPEVESGTEVGADAPVDPPRLAGVGDPGGAGTGPASGDYRAVVARGRAVEGERFDRRLRAYAALRERGVVPKTGFKFGADFRTYAEVESVDDLGHSELLVRVLPAGHRIPPRDLALDVRLAHGVRKRMVFALVGDPGDPPGWGGGWRGREPPGEDPGIAWRFAARFTP